MHRFKAYPKDEDFSVITSGNSEYVYGHTDGYMISIPITFTEHNLDSYFLNLCLFILLFTLYSLSQLWLNSVMSYLINQLYDCSKSTPNSI